MTFCVALKQASLALLLATKFVTKPCTPFRDWAKLLSCAAQAEQDQDVAAAISLTRP